MPILECGKISRCDIRGPKELDFVLCMLYIFAYGEVRLHLSKTFENIEKG